MKRIIVITAIIIISIIVVGLVLYWLNSTDGFKSSETASNSAFDTIATSQQLETNYFTAVLPAGYEIVSNTEKESGTERLNIVATNTTTNTTLQIIIGDIPSGGINGLSIYTDRSQNTEQYTRQSFSGMPVGVETFYATNNGYELAAFWVNGSLYAAIIMSSPTADSGQINVTMQAFLDQWRWR